MGQLYVDGVGSALTGLFISGTAPAQANAGTNITYTLNYNNGGGDTTGVTAQFTLPPNTTFVSINAPGLTCTTPAAGATGVVNCTIGNLAAGAGGSFQITVNINPAATGTINAGNYSIQSADNAVLLGPLISTIVGCSKDAQCPTGEWCNESGNVCTPTLANGVVIANDPPHTTPTLNGTCTVTAGALVCTSAVCDLKDNRCGFLNGDGACNAGNGAV